MEGGVLEVPIEDAGAAASYSQLWLISYFKLDIVALRKFVPLKYVSSFYFFGTSVKGEYGM